MKMRGCKCLAPLVGLALMLGAANTAFGGVCFIANGSPFPGEDKGNCTDANGCCQGGLSASTCGTVNDGDVPTGLWYSGDCCGDCDCDGVYDQQATADAVASCLAGTPSATGAECKALVNGGTCAVAVTGDCPDSCDSGVAVSVGGDCCDPECGGLTAIDDGVNCTNDACNSDGTVTSTADITICRRKGGWICSNDHGAACGVSTECKECSATGDQCDDADDCSKTCPNGDACTDKKDCGLCGGTSGPNTPAEPCVINTDCQAGDTCQQQTCADETCGNQGLCDDDNSCTNEQCSANQDCAGGLTLDADGTGCGDSSDDDCGNPDTCDKDGVCQGNDEDAGEPCGRSANTDCDDPDTCDGAGGCNDNNEADGKASGHCTDGSVCVTDADCGNVDPCTPGCDDGEECTNDVCDGGRCDNVDVDDGTLCGDAAAECNTGGACAAGSCDTDDLSDLACDNGENLAKDGDSCDDNDDCKDDGECLPRPCDDGDVCTDDDACSSGVCGGSTIDCNDGLCATDDACDKDDGCINDYCGETADHLVTYTVRNTVAPDSVWGFHEGCKTIEIFVMDAVCGSGTACAFLNVELGSSSCPLMVMDVRIEDAFSNTPDLDSWWVEPPNEVKDFGGCTVVNGLNVGEYIKLGEIDVVLSELNCCAEIHLSQSPWTASALIGSGQLDPVTEDCDHGDCIQSSCKGELYNHIASRPQVIDGADLGDFATSWPPNVPDLAAHDYDLDGVVGMGDLSFIAAAFDKFECAGGIPIPCEQTGCGCSGGRNGVMEDANGNNVEVYIPWASTETMKAFGLEVPDKSWKGWRLAPAGYQEALEAPTATERLQKQRNKVERGTR